MPPKRKRAADDAAAPKTTRSTRSSTRNKESFAEANDGESSVVLSNTEVVVPPPKRKRKTAAKASSKKTASGNATINGDDVVPPGDSATPKPPKSASKAKPTDPSIPEPYDPARLPSLFAEYADEDDQNVIGPEGFERLCNDVDISLEGALPLILSWQLGAREMAKVTKGEWEKGLAALRISSLSALSIVLHDLENLLILEKAPLKPTTQSTANKKGTVVEPYSRDRYFQYAADVKKTFSELYMFLFVLTKPPQSRNIDMETACAFWSVVLVPKYLIANDIITFINDKGTYKAVTKDLWSMMLEFCRAISPDLSDYEADGAWPSLLDDFVSTTKGKTDTVSADTTADR